MILDPTTRLPWLLVIGSACALEAAALYFQYGMRLDPCVLCIYQRVAVFGLLFGGLIGAIQPRLVVLRLVGYAGILVSAVLGLRFAFQQIAVLRGDRFDCSFMPDFPVWLPLHEWLPLLFQPTGMCGELDWSFLGFTMPEVMVGVFFAYLAGLAVAGIGEWARFRRTTATQ
jgi:disulfide bond formation protein DsbB